MQKQRHGTGVDSAGAPAPSVEVWGGVNLSEHKWVFFGEYCTRVRINSPFHFVPEPMFNI